MSKILIVEDDCDHARVLSLRLQAEGFSVVVAQDAYQATRIARDEQPDLVVLDVNLPAGDGFRVHERLNGIFRERVPVIYLTGQGREDLVSRARALGASACFRKPVRSEAFLDAVRRVLPAQGVPA